MYNKRNSSTQQSIDTILKLSIDLKNELLEQLQSFNSSKNHDLLKKLTELPKFRNKRIKNQISYLEINIHQVEKIAGLLCKLDSFNRLRNPSDNLKSEIDNLKEETIHELIMLPFKLYLEFETNEDINPNYDQYYTNNESNDYELNNESNNYELNNESNDYEPINNSNYDESVNPGDDQIIIDLPINHILPIIFKELSIKDLLTCRLVNKLFKHFSDHTNGINKLIIGQPDSDEDNDYYWYYNYKLIEDKDIISLKCFRTIQRLSIFNLDKYLKYLKIYDQQLKLEELSNLINLQSIEFGHFYRNDNQKILHLNNLEVFVSNNCSVQLNTPKLEKIRFYNINWIKLNSNPESIKHLITFDYDNKLEIFKNLEVMELRYTEKSVNKNLLSTFKYLKQLKINLDNNLVNYSNEKIKNKLIKILNDKIKLKRSIDIYLEGIRIENIDKFNELVSNQDSFYWKFRLNNYDLLDLDLSFIYYLNYDELEECVNNIKNDLPSSFFDKFIHTNEVLVDSVKDIDGLKWFLNKLKYLTNLEIYVSLDEVFYYNLPNTIRYLDINNREDINCDFILKLSKLTEFNTYVDKDLFDLAFKSFLNLKYLKKFEFNYNKKEIVIEKINKLYFNLNNKKRKFDYNQLIEECNKIRSKSK